MNPKGNIKNLTNAGKGRPRGAKNKYSFDVRKMVLDAVNDRGGADFFKTLDAPTLARVASKLIPNIFEGTGENGGITVIIKKHGE